MKAFIKSLTMAAALSFAGTASAAIVYNVNQTVQTGGVTGTITTDGTIGSIGSGNITAWNLILSGGAATFNLTNGNSGVFVTVPSHVTATAQNLFFDYDTPNNGYLLFQVSFGDATRYWCNAAGVGTSTCFQGATVTPQSIGDPSLQVEAERRCNTSDSISNSTTLLNPVRCDATENSISRGYNLNRIIGCRQRPFRPQLKCIP